MSGNTVAECISPPIPPQPSARLLEEKYRRALLLILRKKAVELNSA